ncbi:MAG TPA: GAF domain-containing sensor histidine kinase [Spirochaetota bacterium]|nr:GAF domain-containing sensor histidine kinase [Spirochaetota bacterium]HOS33357.1 GAF domain-containing sensor histidine kinase [Spirochaetota bacterium]HOS56158.1 GAF domain-containing sensor histidine kinase [Spirochaetota bacterium]HPK62707.1 GAF domain-containing sensor histidine kinase [Spirochaetota bacterium]HQF78579.1 GAF domain-containing sensor histidine kinase [Spirochaetota bacterium]
MTNKADTVFNDILKDIDDLKTENAPSFCANIKSNINYLKNIFEENEKELAKTKGLLKERERELSVVYELEKSTSALYNLDELLSVIIHETANIIHAKDCTIFLKQNYESDELYVKKTQSDKIDEVIKIRLKVGEGIVGWVVQTGKPIIANDLKNEPRWNDKFSKDANFPTNAIMCAPMIFNDKIIGAIEVINKLDDDEIFETDDLRVLTIIANQTAKAIETTRLLKEIQDSERLTTIGSMANGIIHDIKNPMAVIKGYAELIGYKSPENMGYVKKITESINRLVSMAQELLDFSRGESNLNFKKTNINAFILNFIEFIYPLFRENNISISSNLQYEGDIVCDSEKLTRVFMNIATNARDAMPNGGAFSINSRLDGDFVVFSLTDTGCGIEDNIKSKLFEPFVTYGKPNGTGLGMAISKKIILNHKGEIGIESAKDKGTTIIIKIPINLDETVS